MWFYLTIVILFTYTILLIAFFMGWCTLIPTRCHSRKELPFSTVKSPRRHTKFGEIDSISSSASMDMFKLIPSKEIVNKSKTTMKIKKNSIASSSCSSGYQPRSDYLHPKYSLPPIDLEIGERAWEFERLLRTPGKQNRLHSSHPEMMQNFQELDSKLAPKILAEIV